MTLNRAASAVPVGLLLVALASAPAWAGHESGHVTAVFDPVPGNEWWVEVYVEADEPLAGVDARADGGSWVALEKKDWGAWAKSFHVESGSVVEFRATSTDGDTVVSDGYVWPGAEPAGDGDGEMSAVFDPVPGNEWWVEVYVRADEPLAGVDARADGGPWVALEKRDWGAWAKSFHVESGSVVEFRATSTDGDTVVSDGFLWPSAQPAGGGGGGDDPPDTTDIAFGPKAGNEWWVETLVVAEEPPSRVQARADGGAWHELTLRDWGAWAGSFHVPDGAVVEFRATNPDGTDTSDGFVWPDAVVVGGDGGWPEEGSYARYATFASDPEPSSTDGHRTFIRHEGAWWVFERETREGASGTSTSQRFCTTDRITTGPTVGVDVGDTVEVRVGGCFDSVYEVVVRERSTYDTHREGDPATAETWYADRTDPCNCLEWTAEWDRGGGLLMHSDRAGRGSVGADLLDTDAPV